MTFLGGVKFLVFRICPWLLVIFGIIPLTGLLYYTKRRTSIPDDDQPATQTSQPLDYRKIVAETFAKKRPTQVARPRPSPPTNRSVDATHATHAPGGATHATHAAGGQASDRESDHGATKVGDDEDRGQVRTTDSLLRQAEREAEALVPPIETEAEAEDVEDAARGLPEAPEAEAEAEDAEEAARVLPKHRDSRDLLLSSDDVLSDQELVEGEGDPVPPPEWPVERESEGPDLGAPGCELLEEGGDIEKARELKDQGNAAMKKGDYDEAIQLYAQSLEFTPASEATHASLVFSNAAAVYLLKGEYQQAIDAANNAIEFNPKFGKAYLRRYRGERGLDKIHDAAVSLKTACELDPEISCSYRLELIDVERESRERAEKEKEEMIGKLKDMGRWALGKFGINMDDISLQQNPDNGSWSIQYKGANLGGNGAGGAEAQQEEE